MIVRKILQPVEKVRERLVVSEDDVGGWGHLYVACHIHYCGAETVEEARKQPFHSVEKARRYHQ